MSDVLELLREGKAISGETLREALGISRAGVWKQIEALRAAGYEIEADKQGYMLLKTGDDIRPPFWQHALNTDAVGRTFFYKPSTDSTNEDAKNGARGGAPHGSVFLADAQQRGKGRLGRSWISLPGQGVWMSVLLRPRVPTARVVELTQVAAAAVVNALDALKIHAGIKWPNDIIVEQKKACGILVEAAGDIDEAEYVVIGIGMNVRFLEKLPPEVEKTAIAIEKPGQSVDRARLVALLLDELEACYKRWLSGDASWRAVYLERSLVLGKQVSLISRTGDTRTASVLGLEADGSLLVRLEDGREERVISDEVSVRGLMGYVP